VKITCKRCGYTDEEHFFQVQVFRARKTKRSHICRMCRQEALLPAPSSSCTKKMDDRRHKVFGASLPHVQGGALLPNTTFSCTKKGELALPRLPDVQAGELYEGAMVDCLCPGCWELSTLWWRGQPVMVGVSW
jgi:hypothetical protein